MTPGLSGFVAAADGIGGCPEIIWDGPYRMRCGMGIDDCSRHGRFQAVPRPQAAPVPASPAEVASRLSAAAEVCEQHRHHGLAYEFSQLASHLDEDGYSAEVCAAVARALSGPVTTTEAQEG